MKLFNQLYLSCFILLAGSCFAQVVPGYLGLKTIAAYQFNVSPALNHPTYLNRVRSKVYSEYPKADEAIMLPFNCTHTFKLERVMGRKFSMALNYSFAASKEYITLSQDMADNQLGYVVPLTFSQVKMNVFGNYFTGSMVFYGERALAPFGKYFKLDVSYASLVTSFPEPVLTSTATVTNAPSTIYTFDLSDTHYSLNTYGFGCSFGTNRIYNKHIVINRGFSLFYLAKGSNYYQDSKGILPAIYNRMKLRDVASFYLSVGYLF